ncbi:hypothetical protein D918_07907 [Trichuris suis]|nr:hypothetical protein D918_07907 [Trichuris suis]
MIRCCQRIKNLFKREQSKGPKAVEYRGLLSIHYPMEHGVITNWNDMELIWQYLYGKDMLQTFPEEHPVLLTEPALNPMRNRERASEFFFETFNVPALFISMQAVLSLYSTVEVLLFNFRFLPRISTAMVD